MADWRQMLADLDWKGLERIKFERSKPELQALFAALVDVLPRIEEVNGTERWSRPVKPNECEKRWEGGARLYWDGELEALAASEPRDDIDIWTEMRGETELDLQEFELAEEVTSGNETLSRRQHARDARELLRQIAVAADWTRMGIAGSEDDPCLDELVSAVAWRAFLAGRHAQAAHNKSIEADAVRGAKVRKAASQSGQMTKARNQPLRTKRLERMAELVPRIGADKAAAQYAIECLGSTDAIKRQWYRWKRVTAGASVTE